MCVLLFQFERLYTIPVHVVRHKQRVAIWYSIVMLIISGEEGLGDIERQI